MIRFLCFSANNAPRRPCFESRPSFRFRIGSHNLKEVDSYCYLGIEIHKSGSFTAARTELKKKAMRALYSLKSTVNKSKLSFRSLTTLFDSLIKPIALYGTPIVTPNMSILKHIYRAPPSIGTNDQSHSSILKKISLINCEKVHLHFLKWALGVNRKSSNAGVWGESGRYPLIYECIKLTMKYVERLNKLDDNSLVKLAFEEQKNMNLSWYKGIEPILKIDPSYTADHVTAFNTRNSKHSEASTTKVNSQNTHTSSKEEFLFHNGFKKRIPQQNVAPSISRNFTSYIIMKALKTKFKESWFSNVQTSSKLEFYKQVKQEFVKENYLDSVKNYFDRISLTRLRISAHRLMIELGRRTNAPRSDRVCAWCEITLGTRETENEIHFLDQCDLNAILRRNFKTKIESFHATVTQHVCNDPSHVINLNQPTLQIADDTQYKTQVHLTRIIARFVSNSYKNREKFLESLK